MNDIKICYVCAKELNKSSKIEMGNNVCFTCFKDHSLFISKTNAKKEYFLKDVHLGDIFFIEKLETERPPPAYDVPPNVKMFIEKNMKKSERKYNEKNAFKNNELDIKNEFKQIGNIKKIYKKSIKRKLIKKILINLFENDKIDTIKKTLKNFFEQDEQPSNKNNLNSNSPKSKNSMKRKRKMNTIKNNNNILSDTENESESDSENDDENILSDNENENIKKKRINRNCKKNVNYYESD
jgi:hypothetical protein